MAADVECSSQGHLVFVYGTLKRGQPNEERIKDKERGEMNFLCRVVTVDKWPLVIATEHQIPFLLHQKGTGKQIKGELYRVDDKMLAFLDYFERHPNVYQRTTIKVKILEASSCGEFSVGEEVTCSTYMAFNFAKKLLELPTIEEYDDNTAEVKLNRNLTTDTIASILVDLGIITEK